MENILEVKNITKCYPGVVALDNVSFAIEEGTVHALVGENGAGKSTLIKVITGAILPDHGEIIYKGNSYKELNLHHIGGQFFSIYKNSRVHFCPHIYILFHT